MLTNHWTGDSRIYSWGYYKMRQSIIFTPCDYQNHLCALGHICGLIFSWLHVQLLAHKKILVRNVDEEMLCKCCLDQNYLIFL